MTDRAYTTKAKIEAFLGISSGVYTFENEIKAAQKFIEDFTEKIFKADSSATARLFDGDGSNEIVIDDCTSVSKVETGNDAFGDSFTEVLATGSDRYFLKPNNYDKFDPKLPIRYIVLRARHFINGIQNQRVTAKWGSYDACPDDVSFAATIIAAGMYNERVGGDGLVKSERIGDYQVSYTTDQQWLDFSRAQDILKSYQRINI